MTAEPGKEGSPWLAGRRALFLLLAGCSLTPWVSAPVALGVGIGFGLLLGSPWPSATAKISRKLLQLSVIGLGFGIGITEVWRAGSSGFLYTLVGISTTMAVGLALGRVLRVKRKTAALVSFGTAICGGSAIAAMAPVVEAEPDEIAVSLATVFTLNAVALFLFPGVGHGFGLEEREFGLWAALAIHDTSSVVGAGSVYGASALALATTVKLARAAWIAPITLAAGWVRRSESKATVPWFILGFIGAACLRSLLPDLQEFWRALFATARQGLVLTLFLIGGGITRGVFRTTGARPLIHGVLLWVFVGSTTLLFIVAGVIG